MGGISHQMLKRRAEHNEGTLHTLEELVLQEEGIDKIDNVLGALCPNLRILYMPNNLIPKIENFHRLKELRYLNLAINNIVKVEGLEHCEFLEKLDLTLNFIEKKELTSVSSLRHNIHLQDLYLTGNPCQDFSGYRKFVVASLPSLQRLDACSIKPSERITANQDLSQIAAELSSEKENILLPKEEAKYDTTSSFNCDEQNEVIETGTDTWFGSILLLPGLQSMLSCRIYENKKEVINWNFKLHESNCGKKILLDVPAGRFLDSSLIEVDVHPLLVRVLINGKLLQLRLPEEQRDRQQLVTCSFQCQKLQLLLVHQSHLQRFSQRIVVKLDWKPYLGLLAPRILLSAKAVHSYSLKASMFWLSLQSSALSRKKNW